MTDAKHNRRRGHLSLVGEATQAQRGVGRFSSRDTDALQIGATCGGRYLIMRRIAQGGIAEIYEAYDTQMNGYVALKTLQLKHRNNSAIARRAAEEARTLLRLKHPHLVRVRDAGIDDATGSLYFAMELLQGCDLRHLLVFHGALPLRVALDLVQQLAKGVQALHDQGIIHRDLKPENVFVQRLPTGRLHVKLLDLGAAKLDYKNHVTTSIGTTHGTAQYMSPEQASGETKLDPKCDVYALGLILIELLLETHLAMFGERPPYTLGEWTDWQRSYPKPDLRAFLPDASPDVVLLLTGCIERLSRRVPDAGFLVDAIAAIQIKLGPVDMDAAHRAIELPEVTSFDAAAPAAHATRADHVKIMVDSRVTPRTPYARTEERRDPAPPVVAPPSAPPPSATPASAEDERDTLRMAQAPRFDVHFEAPAEPTRVKTLAARSRGEAVTPAPVAAAPRARRDSTRRRKLTIGLALVVAVPAALALAVGVVALGTFLGTRQPAAPAPTVILVAVPTQMPASPVPVPEETATPQVAAPEATTVSSAPASTLIVPAAPASPATAPQGAASPSPPAPAQRPAARQPPPQPEGDPWAPEF